jgi:hypothetical protein
VQEIIMREVPQVDRDGSAFCRRMNMAFGILRGSNGAESLVGCTSSDRLTGNKVQL